MLLAFTALTAVMTYPQVLHLRDGVHDDGDPLLNTWTLAWVAHQLPRAPARLFDANIFYPERKTLAFTETLLLPGLVAAPLQWIGVAPLLVHNLVLLSGFVLSGAGTEKVKAATKDLAVLEAMAMAKAEVMEALEKDTQDLYLTLTNTAHGVGRELIGDVPVLARARNKELRTRCPRRIKSVQL